MTRNILLVLMLVAAVGLAAWLWRTDDVAPALPAADASASADAPATSVDAQPAPRPAAPLPPVPDFGSAAFDAEATRQNAETSARLEKNWAADHTDPRQTAEVERNLVEKSASPALLEVRDQPSKITSIGCRSTMCRIEASFPGGSSPSEWTTRMLIEMGPAFQTSTMVSMPGEKGQATVVLYAFRPGVDPNR